LGTSGSGFVPPPGSSLDGYSGSAECLSLIERKSARSQLTMASDSGVNDVGEWLPFAHPSSEVQAVMSSLPETPDAGA